MTDTCFAAALMMAAPAVATPPAVERAVEFEADGIDGDEVAIEDDDPGSDDVGPDSARDALVAFILLGTVPLLLLLAYRWRRCGCGGTLIKLDEVADDAYLSPGQRAEERLGAIDHVVLACPRCTAIAYRERRPWISWFSRCPICHLRTVRTTAVMVAAPALGRTGLAEHVTWCDHCPHRRSVHYELPALAPRDDDG